MDKQYLKNVVTYVFTAILSILVISYILYSSFGKNKDAVETLAAVPVTERETVTFEAYVMREEKLIYSALSGSANYLYKNGSKVAITAPVVNIYNDGASDERRADIIALENKISVLEASNIQSDLAMSDTSVIDTDINELYLEIVYRMENGEIDYALQKRDDLLTLMNKRQIVVKNVTDYQDKIASLQSNKISMTGYSGNISETVSAEYSGYFYADIDGYEDIFSSDNVSTMTISDFDRMKETPPQAYEYVSDKGYAVGKIVTDYNWYIACETTVDSLRSFHDGSVYTVIFPYSSDTEISMKLDRVVTEPDGKRVVLVFKTGRNPINFNFLRRQTVEVVESEYNGYRVPISSVRIADGRQGVYILDGNVVQFREIVPLAESNGYFIIEEQSDDPENDEAYKQLGLYDLVIIRGTNLYEGKIIE